MNSLDQQFHIQQKRRAASQPHPLRGFSFARLFIPFTGSVCDEQPLDTPTYLRRRIARAQGQDSIRLIDYTRRLGEYMRHNLETLI